jgi:hypothetical protein
VSTGQLMKLLSALRVRVLLHLLSDPTDTPDRGELSEW